MKNFLKKHGRISLPRTYWGLPVISSDQVPAEPQTEKRGVALLLAIMLISMMMIFSADMIITSHVNLELASRQRDNMSAEYMAKSGLAMGEFLLAVDYGVDLAMAKQVPPSDGEGDMWSTLNGMEIGSTTAELLDSFKEGFGLNDVLDEGVINSLKAFEGSFTMNISDEAGKINLNQCTNTANCRQLMTMLEGLFSCPVEKEFLEKKDLTPAKLAALIRDYIDKDSSATAESGYGEENVPYEKMSPPYQAKNAPLDSLDELLLIEGWDDELHAIFSPYLTVYPIPPQPKAKMQINLNTASRELLTCLLPESRDFCGEQSAVGLYNREKKKANLVAGSIEQTLSDVFCHKSSGENKKSDWFTQQSRVFKVVSEGRVGESLKVLSAVVERTIPDAVRGKPFEDNRGSVRQLYWRMR